MGRRGDVTEWEEGEMLQNGKKGRCYRMGRRGDVTEWEEGEMLLNGKKGRCY